ncbi:UDP-glycosyltransferase 71K1-like [Durio zibethinus]|uniref:Glycosyltransferase n=1 Tax=Durio zibethinus TaxID=66656 RepID=A0A6P6AYU0_DURZI|nr:UDP-glycosyltransferase 71K1-like [Durio zibethinus]
MEKMEVVFIPAPAIGHLVSNVEFAKRLRDQDDRFSVTVLIIDPLLEPKVQTYVRLLAASDARIRFIIFPKMETDPLSNTKSPYIVGFEFLESHKSNIKEYIINHVLPNYAVSAALFVVDAFAAPMIDVANELSLPSYLFYTSGAATLGFMLHAVTRHDQVGRVFQASDGELVIPSFTNPVPCKVIPSLFFDENGGYIYTKNSMRRLKETKGIIVNSFEELEPQAVKSLVEYDIPPFYLVGPVLELRGHSSSMCDEVQNDEIMKWLDNQPPSTVVFICFGSVYCVVEPQAMEIARGLEQCGHRFLWSLPIRSPRNQGLGIRPSNCPNLKEILPEGFLQRTEGRGMVCGWAPQVEVLAHKSIGGFLSHCGWNSILESLWYGVPILTWPMHGEQQMNAFQMVKDLGLAVEMRLDYKLGESDAVMADEIGKALNCLMDGDSEVRKRVKKMSEMSRKAVKNSNGSSFTSFARLIDLFLMGNANKP